MDSSQPLPADDVLPRPVFITILPAATGKMVRRWKRRLARLIGAEKSLRGHFARSQKETKSQGAYAQVWCEQLRLAQMMGRLRNNSLKGPSLVVSSLRRVVAFSLVPTKNLPSTHRPA